MELCKLAFRDVPGAEISDLELRRGGRSYTADTLEQLMGEWPGAEFTLLLGTDMFLKLEEWYRFPFLAANCRFVVLSRDEGGDRETEAMRERLAARYGARVTVLAHTPLPVSSGEVRRKLRARLGSELLDGRVYAEVIRRGYYEARPELCWLRERAAELLKPSRIAHVAGCESEAVLLAHRWGEDGDTAAEAAILHDITKKRNLDEQLILCEKYGIIPDEAERRNPQLLHAKTGAWLARERFGVSEAVFSAIFWHTTGKPDMTLLEKIIYLADMIEPTRTFDGVEELRRLCYEDIDRAMAAALSHSLEHIRAGNIEPHRNSVEAYLWYTT